MNAYNAKFDFRGYDITQTKLLFAQSLQSICSVYVGTTMIILLYSIIALKASGRDCTNNNELLHKIGVLQRYVIEFFLFIREVLQ